MNSEWQNYFFSKPAVVIPRRRTGAWICSGCLRDFVRPCNAALHLKQSRECQKTYSMIYTLKEQGQDLAQADEEKKADLPEEEISYPFFLQVGLEDFKDDGIGENINEKAIIRRTTRLGKRNWSPGYIIRVYDWCMARKAESDSTIGRRALSRLGSEFWKVPEKTVYRWL